MLDTATIIEQFAKLSVNINGLIVPGRPAQSILARHAFNLFVHNDDETFKISLVGSATAVKFNDQFFLLATQHQLRNVDEQNVAMLTDNGSHVITSGGRRGYMPSSQTDAYDIVAFDFTEPCNERPELKRRFFDLTSGAPPDTLNVNVLAMVLAGCPAADQKYEIHENNHVGLARRSVVGLPEGQPADVVLLRVRVEQPFEVDPDGMSGGSAFVVQFERGEPKAYFAGIIIRGGREYFHILKAGYIISFLRSFALKPAVAGGPILQQRPGDVGLGPPP